MAARLAGFSLRFSSVHGRFGQGLPFRLRWQQVGSTPDKLTTLLHRASRGPRASKRSPALQKKITEVLRLFLFIDEGLFPSHGRGNRFNSCRAHHEKPIKLGTSSTARSSCPGHAEFCTHDALTEPPFCVQSIPLLTPRFDALRRAVCDP
jgi:hypothetical protein